MTKILPTQIQMYMDTVSVCFTDFKVNLPLAVRFATDFTKFHDFSMIFQFLSISMIFP